MRNHTPCPPAFLYLSHKCKPPFVLFCFWWEKMRNKSFARCCWKFHKMDIFSRFDTITTPISPASSFSWHAQNHRGMAHPRERLISVLWGDLFVRSASIASQACSLTHQHTFLAPGSIPTVSSYHAFFLFCAHAAAACFTLTLFYL